MALPDCPVRVMEVCKVTPPLEFTESASESSLPLTFFDTFWFKFHPVERIFFYGLTTDSAFFFSSILPKIKRSLSLTLLHFLPFAGNLVWPSYSDKPFILYTPNDGVYLTVAESDADFHCLSGDSIRGAADSHHYIPELAVSDTHAATMCFQITLFPNQGFCIGISSHHAIFDGKSIIMFLKSWAHICKHSQEYQHNRILPQELTPVLDRTIAQDPQGLDMVYLNNWISVASRGGNSNPRSLKLFSIFGIEPTIDMVRGTFELSGEDIKKLRKKALSHQLDKKMHFSTFVLTFAYVAITIVKTKGLERNKKLIFVFTADIRGRLDPPLPGNYFGNCVSSYPVQTEAGFVIEENGLAFLAEKLTQVIKGLEKGALDGAKEKLEGLLTSVVHGVEGTAVAGSTRFEVYGTDFGWGKPKKVEVTSIDRSGSISLAESRDGSGGVEVGLVLKKHEMKMFDYLFVNGFKYL